MIDQCYDQSSSVCCSNSSSWQCIGESPSVGRLMVTIIGGIAEFERARTGDGIPPRRSFDRSPASPVAVGLPGSEEFNRAYEQALAGAPRIEIA